MKEQVFNMSNKKYIENELWTNRNNTEDENKE